MNIKNLIWIPCFFLFSACGDEGKSTDSSAERPAAESQKASEPAPVEKPAPKDITPIAQSAKLPWDIPTMPNVRVIHSSSKFSRTSVRRGGESTALITFKGSAAEIVAFYEQALPKLGFKITPNKNNTEKSSRAYAEHADGRKFQVYASRGGSKAREGESSATLVATKPKLKE